MKGDARAPGLANKLGRAEGWFVDVEGKAVDELGPNNDLIAAGFSTWFVEINLDISLTMNVLLGKQQNHKVSA